ncbi:MAG: hypothetical protein AAF915_01885 [Cyanobacteria bacterium P01_D01_bin.50]
MRIRIDVWVSLKPKLQKEIEQTGLTASQIVNTVLADYFKELSKNKFK